MKKTLFVLYAFFLLGFTLFSYLFIDPNLIYLKNIYSGFAFDNRALITILYTWSVSVFFIFYSIFVWLGIKKKLKFKDVIILISITIGCLILSYPAMLSYDIFNYIATSKALFFYHENPYVVMPIEFTGDPLLSFTHAANKIALYAPFWIILTGIPYMLGLGNFIVGLFSFKIFIAIFYLATIILIWKMSKNIVSVILFSLNPLVVIETLISGHNDIVMIFFALLSFTMLVKKRIFLAIFLFALSILIKYATLLLIPVFLYMLWKIIKGQEINWKIIFYVSSLLMFAGFLLSPIREEIYPWYAIWFLPFTSLLYKNKILNYLSISLCFGLLLRYAPFMYLGTYLEPTPTIKQIVTLIPTILLSLFYVLKKKI